jgi:hypothetical protein
MQVNLLSQNYFDSPTFCAIRADRNGRQILKSRISNMRNPDQAWDDLAKLIKSHENDANDIYITRGNSDFGLGATVFNRKTNYTSTISEGPNKIDTPIEFIERAIAIGKGFNKSIREIIDNSKADEVLEMM